MLRADYSRNVTLAHPVPSNRRNTSSGNTVTSRSNVLKSDQEPAMKAAARSFGDRRKNAKLMEDGSPPYDIKSNGAVGRAVVGFRANQEAG